MQKSWILSCVILLMLLTGCSGPVSPESTAALIKLPDSYLADWQLPSRIKSSGEGAVQRIVKGKNLDAPQALEIAASPQGKTEYSLEAGEAMTFFSRFQFLSTQGTGRLIFTSLKPGGEPSAQIVFVYTGPLCPRSRTDSL